VASAAVALAAYLLWIGWQDGQGTYCTIRHPCDDPLVDFQFRFVAFIVTLAVAAAIAAWSGRAFVATVWLIVVPLATAQINADVSDLDLEATGLFQLALLAFLAPVLVAVAIGTALVARLVRARRTRSNG
jgi:hypothetical protein